MLLVTLFLNTAFTLVCTGFGKFNSCHISHLQISQRFAAKCFGFLLVVTSGHTDLPDLTMSVLFVSVAVLLALSKQMGLSVPHVQMQSS